MLLIAGIVAGRYGLPYIIYIILAFCLLFVTWRKIHLKQLHIIYLSYFLLFILGFIVGNNSIKPTELRLALENSKTINCEISAIVEKCNKTEYGFKLILKKQNERCLMYSDAPFIPGTRIKASGTATLIRIATNTGEFDMRKYYDSIGVTCSFNAHSVEVIKKASSFFEYLELVKKKAEEIIYRICPKNYASALCALLLGNRDMLDDKISELFYACGIGHILAISGLHISLLGMGLYEITRKVSGSYITAMLVGVIFISLYGVLTGNSISTVRALLMFIISSNANVVARTYDMQTAASIAAGVILLFSPEKLENTGFILSFSAICGVCVINPYIVEFCKPTKKITQALIGGISIQLATVPIIMYFNYEIPTFAILLNLIVLPLMTIMMYSAIAGLILGSISIFIGKIFILPAILILKIYEIVCDINLKIPGARLVCGSPQLWQMGIYYLLLFAILFVIHKNPCKWKAILFMLPLFIILARVPQGTYVSFLDVGQGDGIFIHTSAGNILIDCGSSSKKNVYQNILQPYMFSQGYDELKYVVVTHGDADHLSAISEMIEARRVKIGQIYLASSTYQSELYQELETLAKENGIAIKYLSENMKICCGETTLLCVHPSFMYNCEDANASSIVLSLELGTIHGLFMGDLPGELETELKLETAKYDFLKVGHHGSKYSTTEELLKKIRPDYSIISCGYNNRYGHPHQEVLERLDEIQSAVLRTDELGEIRLLIGKGHNNFGKIEYVCYNNPNICLLE